MFAAKKFSSRCSANNYQLSTTNNNNTTENLWKKNEKQGKIWNEDKVV